MRIPYSALILLALAACDSYGDAMPINPKKVLESLDGPKVPTMEETQIEEAKTAEKNGNFSQAAQMYQQLLDKKKDDPQLTLALADSTRRSGEYDKSITIYDRMLAQDAKNLSAKEGKGLALLAKGDYEAPTTLFQEIMKEDGKRWKTLNALGILFVTRGLYPESHQYFQEALRQQPGNVSIMNNLGLSQALAKQYPDAIGTLRKAAALSINGSMDRKRIELNLATVYAASGNLEDAKKLAEVHLSGPALSNNLGLYAHLAKDDKLAKDYLNMALSESKIYYGKAWENLESLNTVDSVKSTKELAPANALKLPPAEEKKPVPAPEKPATKKKSGKKEVKKEESKTTTAAPVSPVSSSTVQSLGTIKAPALAPEKPAEKPAETAPAPVVVPAQ